MAVGRLVSGGLEGMAVLVTGGGTGIGRACAARLAADGAAVTICGRTAGKLEDAAKRIDAQAGHGGSVRWIAADVTKEEDVQRRGREGARGARPARRRASPTRAAAAASAPTTCRTPNEFLRVLHLNVLGTMLCIKHSVPHLVAAGGGSFVGMSSIAGHLTHVYFGAYTAGKAGIEEMMRNAADEFGAKGVRFNAIRPGFIATEIMEGIPREHATYQSYIENTPMGDVGAARGRRAPRALPGRPRVALGHRHLHRRRRRPPPAPRPELRPLPRALLRPRGDAGQAAGEELSRSKRMKIARILAAARARARASRSPSRTEPARPSLRPSAARARAGSRRARCSSA